MDLEDHPQEEQSDVEEDPNKVDPASALHLVNAIDPQHRERLCGLFSLDLPLPSRLVDGRLENASIAPRDGLGGEESSSLETAANGAFRTYVSQYYGGDAVCAVHVRASPDQDAVTMHVLIQKSFTDDHDDDAQSGLHSVWDIQHVVECTKGGSYKATADLFLRSASDTRPSAPRTSIHMTRSTECTLPVQSAASHVVNVGKIVEQVEGKLRSELVDFYGKRVQDFCLDVRTSGGSVNVREQREQLAAELCEKLY